MDVSFYTQPNPNALLGTANQVMDFANKGQENRLLGIRNQQEQLALFNKQIDGMRGIFGGLAAKGPNVSMGDFQAAGEFAIKNGLAQPEQVASFLTTLPPNATPDQMQQFVLDQNANLLDAQQRVNTFFGAPATVDTGGEIQTYRQGFFGNSPTGGFTKSLTPEARTEMIPAGVTAEGQQVSAPRIRTLYDTGIDASGNPVAPGNMMTGQAEGAAAPVNSLTGQPVPAGPEMLPNPPGGIVTSLPTGEKERQLASTERYTADLDAQTQYAEKALPLMESYKNLVAMEKRGAGGGSGIGTDTVAAVKNFLTTWGVPGIDVEGLTDWESTRKYLMQNVLSGSPGTDRQLAAMLSGNPNMDLTTASAKELVGTAIGVMRFKAAQMAAAQEAGATRGDYADFAADWSRNIDPKAFGFDLLSRGEQQKLIEKMTDKEFEKFEGSVIEAQRLGIF